MPHRTVPRVDAGFTLLELMIGVAIVAVLATIAIPVYKSFVARSEASDLIVKIDEMRTRLGVARAAGDFRADCDFTDVIRPQLLRFPYADLALGYEPVTGGRALILGVASLGSKYGKHGVSVTTEAHRLLARAGLIYKDAFISQAGAIFAVRLVDGPLCESTVTGGAGGGSGAGPATSAGTAPTPTPTPTATPTLAPTATPTPTPQLTPQRAPTPVPGSEPGAGGPAGTGTGSATGSGGGSGTAGGTGSGTTAATATGSGSGSGTTGQTGSGQGGGETHCPPGWRRHGWC
jgi:prepilin-type N-terminal cleavage/methylation domain-containing protein